MAEYLSPGVYVEEFSSGIKPMEGVSTSTAGFVGMTVRGPVRGVPMFVGSFGEFQRIFGGYLPEADYKARRFLPMAVEQFFSNGGSRCFVTRLLDENGSKAAAAGNQTIRFTASSNGCWGNQVLVACKKGLKDGFWQVMAADGPNPDDYTEVYSDVNLDPASDSYLVRALEKSLLVRAEYHGAAGDDLCDLFIQLSGEGLAARKKALAEANTALEAAQTEEKAAKEAYDADKESADKKADWEQKSGALKEKQAALSGAENTFTKEEQAAMAAELALETAKQAQAAAKTAYDAANTDDALKKALEARDQELKAAQAAYDAAGAKLAQSQCVLRLSGGQDCPPDKKPCETVDALTLKGDDKGPGKRTGLCALEDVPEVSIVVAPGVTAPAEAQEVITHCEKMLNRVCILDMPEGENLVTELQSYRMRFTSSYAAMYHPWIQVFDPLARKPAYMPPSGAMAGIYARSDNTRGVHKAPANEVIRNCTGLQTLFGKPEQDMLNPVGINLLRNIQGLGIRVWGARTLSDDSSWKYINVRRLFIYIEETIRRNTAWAVFEPNDQLLWTKVRGSITSFLGTLWRDGALFGASESEAYFVNIGKGSTMTDDDILNGRLICVIGVAPVRPAEFVIFRITQIMEQNG